MENYKNKKKGFSWSAFLLFYVLFSAMLFGSGVSVQAEEHFAPTSFTWDGGSGRLKGMECTEIQMRDGQAFATLVIRSENYIYIKVDGVQYDRLSKGERESIFEIPVELNTEMEIMACTTAMSTEHEVEYRIYVGYDPEQEAELTPSVSDSEEQEDEYLPSEPASEYEEVIPEIAGLTFESKMPLRFAKEFDVYYYSDGYKVLSIHNGRQYLLVPEEKELPEGLDSNLIVLKQPLNQIYLAATASMALFDSLEALDTIRLSSVQESGWYIENAAEAMKNNQILFAGKYSEPDYELLIGEGCDLAIESTMILHSPKVQEMLEGMGIPVFIDRSSYEAHPLGRTEWVKLYGAMLNKEDQAETFFAGQSKIIDELENFQNTEKTIAFFYISSDGSVVVRTPEDYVPRMIEIAGGRYVFDYLAKEDSKKSSVNLTMEEFYATAIDADYLVYNATIDDPIYTIDDLLQKDVLFSDFKAVQNGNVWCAGKYLYQATDIVGSMITDLHLMLTDGDENKMTFMTKIQ